MKTRVRLRNSRTRHFRARLRGWIIVDLDERHLPFADATQPGVLDYPDDEILARWLAQTWRAHKPAAEFLGLDALS